MILSVLNLEWITNRKIQNFCKKKRLSFFFLSAYSKVWYIYMSVVQTMQLCGIFYSGFFSFDLSFFFLQNELLLMHFSWIMQTKFSSSHCTEYLKKHTTKFLTDTCDYFASLDRIKREECMAGWENPSKASSAKLLLVLQVINNQMGSNLIHKVDHTKVGIAVYQTCSPLPSMLIAGLYPSSYFHYYIS